MPIFSHIGRNTLPAARIGCGKGGMKMFITVTRDTLTRLGAALGIGVVLGAAAALVPSSMDRIAVSGKANAVPAAVTDWGLSFQTEGQPPVGNATAESLREKNAFYLGNTNEQTIYLTFDAGFENGNAPAILDALKKHHAPACFFLVGNYIDTAPDMVRRMVDEGHTVGNHTMHHPDMSQIADKAAFERELTALEEKYEALIGSPLPRFYRPPQGKYAESNLAQAQELGYTTVFWSLAYVDWYTDNQPTHEQAFSKLIPRIHNGAIVLLHLTSQTNAEILDELLTRWESMGYRFAPITELNAV